MRSWRLPERTLRQQGQLQLPGLSAKPCCCEVEAAREGIGAARMATAARGDCSHVSPMKRLRIPLAQLLGQANFRPSLFVASRHATRPPAAATA